MDGDKAMWSRVRWGTTPREVDVSEVGVSIDVFEKLMFPVRGENREDAVRVVVNWNLGINEGWDCSRSFGDIVG